MLILLSGMYIPAGILVFAKPEANALPILIASLFACISIIVSTRTYNTIYIYLFDDYLTIPITTIWKVGNYCFYNIFYKDIKKVYKKNISVSSRYGSNTTNYIFIVKKGTNKVIKISERFLESNKYEELFSLLKENVITHKGQNASQ